MSLTTPSSFPDPPEPAPHGHAGSQGTAGSPAPPGTAGSPSPHATAGSPAPHATAGSPAPHATAGSPAPRASQASPEAEAGLAQTLTVLKEASRGFWLVNWVNFADGIAYFGILGLLTLFLHQEIGLSDQAAGKAVSNFTGLVTLTMFVGGYVSDALGVRRALGWSLLGITLGRVLLAAAPALAGPDHTLGHTLLATFPSLAGHEQALREQLAYLSLGLMAIASGIMQPALYAGTKEYTDEKTSSVGYGLLYSIMNLGIFFESLISPYVRVNLKLGITGVYWMCAIMTVITLLAHVLLFTRKVEETQSVQSAATPEVAAASTALTIPLSSETPGLLDKLRAMPLFDPRFAFFIFILLPVRTLFAHQWLTMPDYVMRDFSKVVQDKFEWINGVNPLIIVFAVPYVTAVTRKVRVVDMMILGTAVTALSTFLLVPGPDLRLLLLYLVLFSVGEALWSSRFFEYVAELAPPGKVGAYMGLAGIPWFLAKWTTGQYSGQMIERYLPVNGPHHSGQMWLIYGVFACISPLGLILARRWILARGASSQAV